MFSIPIKLCVVDNNDHHNDDDDVSDHDEYKNPTDANMSVSERSKLQKKLRYCSVWCCSLMESLFCR